MSIFSRNLVFVKDYPPYAIRKFCNYLRIIVHQQDSDLENIVTPKDIV